MLTREWNQKFSLGAGMPHLHTFAIALIYGLLASLATIPTSAIAQDPSIKNVVYFRSEEHKFIFGYPKSWAPVPSTHERTIIKVLKNNGAGPEDCSVNVQSLPRNPDATPEAFVKSAKESAAGYIGAMRKAYPDAQLIAKQQTNLSNQAAWMTIAKFTVKSIGVEMPMKVILVQTQKNDRVYSVGCRAPIQSFESTFPTFQSMMLGFLIK